ncbi:MAG: hypothetical protein ACR2NF_11770, partial [Pirellulales bacterium]
ITMSGLNLTGTGQRGIDVNNTTATLAFANTNIEGPSEHGIRLANSSADATFSNTTINLDGAAVIAGIELDTYTGSIDFLNLNAITGASGTTLLTNAGPPNSITIGGASSLTSTSTSSPVIDLTAVTMDIGLTSVSSNFATVLPTTPVAVNLVGAGTFNISDSFLIDGNPGLGTDDPGGSIDASGGVIVTIP